MFGIVGFWRTLRGTQHPVDLLHQMGAALVHPGPGDSGWFYDSRAGLGLAFRRLSIAGPPTSQQPMHSASGRYTIAFNGEIYNHEEIRADLGPAYRWRGDSDTEVVLEAIERWGLEGAVQRFVGMFAFALWDSQQHRLFLLRDRLGIKPLYYGWVGGDFVLASELKAIRRYPEFDTTIDDRALALYMRHNYVPAPYCIYRNIYKLPPGCILTLRSPSDRPEPSRFWSVAEVAQAGLASRLSGSESEVTNELEAKLRQAIRLHTSDGLQMGVLLSGGVDSSTVVALMQAQSNRSVNTFTVGFQEAGYNEAPYAKQVANHLGADHTELYLNGEEARDVIPLLPAVFDEPFADSSQIPTYLVLKLARTRVAATLSGDGGDELFGGYERYRLTRSIWNLIRWCPQPLRAAVAGWVHARSSTSFDRMYGRIRPVIPKFMRMSEVGERAHIWAGFLKSRHPGDVYLRALSQWTPAEVVASCQEPEHVLRCIQESSWLASLAERMMLTDQLNYLPDDMLTKMERASMAVSMEARAPLLDHRLVEFSWKLPVGFKIRAGVSKWILRQVLYRYVPPQLIERPKMGFGIPLGRWLRGPFREWAEDLLSAENLRRHGFFQVSTIRQKWQEHLSGASNQQYRLWTVLVFQDWFFHNSAPMEAAQA